MSAAADLAAAPATAGPSQLVKAAPLASITRNAALRREVFGFVNAGNLGNPAVGYTTWNLRLLSTVAYFGLQVNSGNGNLVTTNTGWAVYHSATMSNFVSAAHANGVRVIVSINLHDYSTNPGNQTCAGLAAANAKNTINQTVAVVAAAGIDGVNVDYEGTDTTCANGLSSRAEMIDFVKNLRAAIPSGSYLAVDTYSGSAEDNLEFFDVTGLAPYVDSFFVMAYDMDFENAMNPPLSCTSYCFNPVSPLNTYRFNVTKTVAQYTALVPASKIILGQPYYGRKACVPGPNVAHQYLDLHQYQAVAPNFVSPQYLDAVSTPTDPAVSSFKAHRDPSDGVSEWDTWWSIDFGCWREQYWDDAQSLGAKYDLVNAANLRGVGLFTLDYGGGSPELWNQLANKFTTTTPWYSQGGVLTSGPDASSWGASRTDMFARGTDNGLWQDTWNGSAWSGWSSLGGVLTSDPGAVSSGPNRIDVFVRGADNGLWHRWWDGKGWSSWQPLGGMLTSGPEASWSAGRLDVFARGTDKGLWHLWWDSKGWSNWQPLGGILTSDPTTVSWGPNRVDVFARGADNGLWHRGWDSTGWSSWQSLGGSLVTAPDASSCATGHLDVFALGKDAAMYQLGYNGAWGSWRRLGGRWTSEPGAVCPPSTTSVDLFERGSDAAVWRTSVPGS